MPASTTGPATDIDGWSVNAGLRYQFTPRSSGAASRMRPPRAWHTYNWTGAYIGAFVGTTWGDEHWFTACLNTSDEPALCQAYLVGGQAATTSRPAASCTASRPTMASSNAKGRGLHRGATSPFFFTCEAELNQLASLTGRARRTPGVAPCSTPRAVGGRGSHGADVAFEPQQRLCPTARPPTRLALNGESNGCLAGPLAPAWSSP